ncbi:hypothetical protein K461DRAFT_272150 [Myriangium duriaei CBS 260.36]|uniref:Uncharacterized protein n=1 Tax=Myriangium duriaei CBS 260.36 TaxID=1168546 RepID=A0A9P4MFI3_9PEZI|nr:hypothetical protein K461DRAFT_272150 [Myriangium duriaei CBS 260.36]
MQEPQSLGEVIPGSPPTLPPTCVFPRDDEINTAANQETLKLYSDRVDEWNSFWSTYVIWFHTTGHKGDSDKMLPLLQRCENAKNLIRIRTQELLREIERELKEKFSDRGPR